MGDFGLATESMDAVDPSDKTIVRRNDHEITLGMPKNFSPAMMRSIPVDGRCGNDTVHGSRDDGASRRRVSTEEEG